MGNHFIKLWWAKRDRITENGVITGNNTQRHAVGVTPASVSSHVSVAYKGKESIQSAVPRSSVAAPPAPDNPKPVITNGPRALPPSQKKLESLEILKEELRKKQEMLDQKRNEFRRQLDKLEKQVDVLKEHFSDFGELVSVELEDVEGQNDADTSKLYTRISFASRLSAERAFLNGKSWQGHILQFKWQLPSSSNKVGGVKGNALTSKDVGVEEETSTARLQPSDTSVHPPAKDGTDLNADATRSGEIENTKKCENDQEDLNVDEDSKSSSMMISGKKQPE